MSKRFFKSTLWYALVFMSILAILLILQWNWLATYESCRIDSVIDTYMKALNSDHIRSCCYDSLDFLDTNIQSKDYVFEKYVMPYLSSELSYKKDVVESTETEQCYAVLSGETKIGCVYFTQNEEPAIRHMFGTELHSWRFNRDSFDFSFLNDSATASISALEQYSVSCNGYLLGEKYISARANSYSELDYLKDYGVVLPYTVTYTVDGFVGDVSFSVTDENGNEVSDDKLTDCKSIVMQSCPEDISEKLSEYLDRYCKYYVAFMGSTRASIYDNYDNLKPYLLSGSKFAERMNSALEGMVWSNNKYNEVLNLNVNYCIDIGDNKYLCDVTYDVKTMGASNEYSTTRNYVRIFVSVDGNSMYTYEMTPYKNAEVIG